MILILILISDTPPPRTLASCLGGRLGRAEQALLPTPVARACGLTAFGFSLIAVMEKLNLELRMWGVPLQLQVGIHSGAVIAGAIGHKTVQWDLCGDSVNTAAARHTSPQLEKSV